MTKQQGKKIVRKAQKPKKTIVKKKKIEKKPKVTKKTIEKKTKVSKKNIKQQNDEKTLDLALICDCTSSMGPWIERAKITLSNIIENIQKDFQEYKINVCFNGYRDFCDNVQYSDHPFTQDIVQIKNFIQDQRAIGGGDIPEDVAGGLYNTLQQNWTSQQRFAFLICDAPCHGQQYHDTYGDSYLNGDPNGRKIEDLMEQFREKQIHFSLIKIRNILDKMSNIMKQSYDGNGFEMEIQDFEQYKHLNQNEQNQIYVDKISYIIKKQLNTKNKKKQVKLWTGDLRIGDWFSSTNYLKIIQINGQKITVINQRNETWEMTYDILNKCDSAQLYNKQEYVTQTDMIDQLQNAGDSVFQVTFDKKIQEKETIEKIIDNKDLDKKKLSKLILQGEEISMISRLYKKEKMGRSLVKNLERGNIFAQIDHRTIKELIIKNVQYKLKKNQRKNQNIKENEFKEENLRLNQWFSQTLYFQVLRIENKDRIFVKDNYGKEFYISQDIIEQDCYSADHFESSEKKSISEMIDIIKNVKDKIFKVKFYKKRSEKEAEILLQDLNDEILNNPKRLKKLVKEILQGEESVMICKYVGKESNMGRFIVKDLNSNDKNNYNIRQIDQRTLNSIIVENMEYNKKQIINKKLNKKNIIKLCQKLLIFIQKNQDQICIMINEQENERFIKNELTGEIEVLKEIVQKYSQREKGYEELDFQQELGGENFYLKSLDTDFQRGITLESIELREQKYGHNRKEKVKTKGFWQLCWETIWDDLILKILIIAGIFSIIINTIFGEEDPSIAWVEGFAILLAVAIVVFVTAWNDLKQEKEFQKLQALAEQGKKVDLIRNGEVHSKTYSDILVGDIMILKSGQEVPGDLIVIEANDIRIDESSMTGETKPMIKKPLSDCIQIKKNLLEKQQKLKHHDVPSNVVLAGTKVLTGTGKGIIANVGKNSAIGKIQDLISSGEDELSPLQLKLEKIARDISFFGLISAILILLALVLRLIIEESIGIKNDEGIKEKWAKGGGDYARLILDYILIAIAILVVAIPEGLPLAVTLALAFSVNKMAKDNNLVRRLQACETMGGANIICSDKTGTLTRNEMFWIKFWNNQEIEIFDSENNTPKNYKNYIHKNCQDLFLQTLILNSDENPKSTDGNPTELALLRYLDIQQIDVMKYRKNYPNKIFDAPFSSDRKRMSKIFDINGQKYIFMKGASEYVLQASSNFHDMINDKIIPMDKELSKKINNAINHMATKSLRTIGLAYKKIDNNIDQNNKDDKGIYQYETQGFTFIGIAGIKDIIRQGVVESIKNCHKAGIDVKMVTGDNKVTARAIAEEINIIQQNDSQALVMEGPEFLEKIGGVICANCKDKEICDCVGNERELDKDENKGKKIRKDEIKNKMEFKRIFKNLKVLARSRPEDKYALVVGLKDEDNVVAVTGDGTNDAPALKKADVGFAMGIAGTEIAKQAADIMIMDDNFSSIIVAVKWGRNIYDSIRKFIQLQLTANFVAVITTFVSALILKEAIFSAVQMLWFNLIIDSLAALALATEPPHDGLLKRKPYRRTEYIITPLMMKHIIGQSIYMSAVIFILVFLGDRFLFDIIGRRQTQDNSVLIIKGAESQGYERDDHNGQYSVHFTYIFNVFVMMQFFNFFNCRVIDDRKNIFIRICKSKYFIWIMVIILILQILFLTFLGRAIRCVMWGLDPISWLFCIAIGMTVWIVSLILKFIPLEKILPGGGKTELKKQDLNRRTSAMLKRFHTTEFYKKQSQLFYGQQLYDNRDNYYHTKGNKNWIQNNTNPLKYVVN